MLGPEQKISVEIPWAGQACPNKSEISPLAAAFIDPFDPDRAMRKLQWVSIVEIFERGSPVGLEPTHESCPDTPNVYTAQQQAAQDCRKSGSLVLQQQIPKVA